ncbi:MAG: PAS domain S-box protein, partial [Deltaproteobacteria bacterium]|nr:PAS domain S-box protein [Deltaproteobacteria bacterium]
MAGKPAYEELVQRVKALEKETLKLRQVERNLRIMDNAVASSINAIGITDLQGKVIYVNESCVKMWGYDNKDDILGRSLPEFWEGEGVLNTIRELREKGVAVGQDVGKRKDGSLFDVEFTASMFKDEAGDPSYMFGSFFDITDRNRAEEALRESEKQFRNFLDNLGDIAYEADARGNVIYGNKMTEIITGVPLNDIIGKPFLPLFTKESQKIAADVYQRTLNGESPEYELTFTNGKICHFKNKPLRDENGKITGVFGIARDITDRRNAEEELRFLSSITEQVKDSVIVTNVDFDITYINKATEKLFGYSQEELIGKPPNILNAEPMTEQIQEDIYRTVNTGKVWTGEHLNRKKDGSIFVCELKISPLANERGQTFGYIGIQRDISERRWAEQALRENEEKYRLLAENVTDVIWTMDMNMKYTFFSPSIDLLQGFTAEEAKTRTLEETLAPKSYELAVKTFYDELEKHQKGERDPNSSVNLEVELFRNDGSTIMAEVQANFLYDENGQPIGVIGVTRDLTKRIEMEEALKRARDELEQRVKERTAELSEVNESLTQEIEERKKSETSLKEREKELEQKTRNLEEFNIAL